MKNYYVYIMTNYSKTLYTGVTNDLNRRVYEHKQKLIPGFTQKYNITKLVYFEETTDVTDAIAREKQIKGWLREKKIALIESINPTLQDLSAGWYE
ncbi:Excinuclease ABC, C subunit, N-terminal [Rivularia sp. IAM M-261]|nr:Excinuclease ABC, C subunit, N-terminal [Calothrix sp. PCC 7716]GJD16266.1 Excinuclease ABC, C subunit, N-terminal [Rivularia sp. IAM M-261]